MYPSEREYHTRVGWWVVTHERSGVAVIGSVAAIALTADLIYAAARWDRLTGSFGRGFTLGFAALILCGLIARLLGAQRPLGTRQQAKRRASRDNLVYVSMIVLFVFASLHYFGSETAALLGSAAALSLAFSLVCLSAILHTLMGHW
jgi:hypothetical protein